jgi:hypothetical protein
MYLDKMEDKASFWLAELEFAVNITTEEFQSKPFSAYYVAKNLTAEEQSYFKVSKFPTLRVYLPTGFQTYDGRLYSRQMSYFLKRNLRSKVTKVSGPLKSLDYYDKLESENEPFVIYCGKENSPDFEMYEKAARDNKFLYYHTFNSDFCTRINAKRTGVEEDLWYDDTHDHSLSPEDQQEWLKHEQQHLKERHERGEIDKSELGKRLLELKAPAFETHTEKELNETLWNQHVLDSNVVFVVYKPNNILEMLTEFKSVDELRKEIELKSISNFYTDFDKIYDQIYEQSFKRQVFALFSPKSQSKNEWPCSELYELSLKKKLTVTCCSPACTRKTCPSLASSWTTTILTTTLPSISATSICSIAQMKARSADRSDTVLLLRKKVS